MKQTNWSFQQSKIRVSSVKVVEILWVCSDSIIDQAWHTPLTSEGYVTREQQREFMSNIKRREGGTVLNLPHLSCNPHVTLASVCVCERARVLVCVCQVGECVHEK